MIRRELTITLAGAFAAAMASGALAATKPAPAPVEVAENYPVYDTLIDTDTAAIRAALQDFGTRGSFLEKRDAAGVAAFYAEQGYTPAWVIDGRLTDRARTLIARLRQADADGLDATAYRTPPMAFGSVIAADRDASARADVMLSLALVTYARQANNGRLDPADISANFDYKPHLPDPVAVLDRLLIDGDPAAALASYNPRHPEFWALRARLAEMRAEKAKRPPMIPAGAALKLGMTDARVAILRERLGVTDTAADPALFDEAVDLAVKSFQEQAGLKPDGIVGRGTMGVLNAAAKDHSATIVANMERWRWMPEDLGPFYVRVNIPNFNLDIYRNGKVDFTTRIVVGQTDKQTPVFSDEIETEVVNPTWNVPASIAVKEMLPKLQAAGGAALRGYQVFANFDGRFRPVDPTMVDWSTVDMRRIQIKQPPGDDNALGSIKFLFPNPYAVYLHDTPSKSFFQRDYRALSHGCMRVMNPWDFAAALLRDDPKVSVDRLRSLVGGKEVAVPLTRHIPVNITYFTAWVDGDGKLQLRNDIYGHDARVEAALGL